MLTENEQAMRARCDAATPDWKARDLGNGSFAIDMSAVGFKGDIWKEGMTSHFNLVEGAGEPNALFVAHARQDLPACLDTIEKLRAELAEARKTLERAYWLVEHFETATYDSKADWCRLARAFLAKHKESNDGNK